MPDIRRQKRGQATLFEVGEGGHGAAASIRGPRPWRAVRPTLGRRKGLAGSRRCAGPQVHAQRAVRRALGANRVAVVPALARSTQGVGGWTIATQRYA